MVANRRGGASTAHEVPLKEQNGAYVSSQTSCQKYCYNILETAVTKVTIGTRVLDAPGAPSLRVGRHIA